jgi:hypothetical protein
LSDEEFLPLDVPKIAAEDAIMFMWAVPHMAPTALKLMAAWGFDYRTHVVWLKEKIGLGQYVCNEPGGAEDMELGRHRTIANGGTIEGGAGGSPSGAAGEAICRPGPNAASQMQPLSPSRHFRGGVTPCGRNRNPQVTPSKPGVTAVTPQKA